MALVLAPRQQARLAGDAPTTPRVGAPADLRAALEPRVQTAWAAIVARWPPAAKATGEDRARWRRVEAVSAAIARGEASVALHELAALERIAAGGDPPVLICAR